MAPKEKVIIRCMDCEQDGIYEMWTDINAKNDKVQKKGFYQGIFHNISARTATPRASWIIPCCTTLRITS